MWYPLGVNPISRGEQDIQYELVADHLSAVPVLVLDDWIAQGGSSLPGSPRREAGCLALSRSPSRLCRLRRPTPTEVPSMGRSLECFSAARRVDRVYGRYESPRFPGVRIGFPVGDLSDPPPLFPKGGTCSYDGRTVPGRVGNDHRATRQSRETFARVTRARRCSVSRGDRSPEPTY